MHTEILKGRKLEKLLNGKQEASESDRLSKNIYE